jgi:hypothetical protein
VADRSYSRPTLIERYRLLANNFKAEGRGFESFRPCHRFCVAQVAGRNVSFTK